MSGRIVKENETDVKDYEFKSFPDLKKKIVDAAKFRFQEISDKKKMESHEFQKSIFEERNNAHENQFRISPMVMEYRGIKRQIEDERERSINAEVEKRVEAIKVQAFEQGFNEGVETGKAEVYQQTIAATEEKLGSLSRMIGEVLETQSSMVNKQRNQIYSLLKTLTKWLLLRELKNDGRYLERLLEKLILEMQAKKNLLIQVNANAFASMPEVLEVVQKKMGQLPNTRVEIDSAIKNYGMIVECENGIINGTIEEQFASLDKLFDQVMTVEGL